MQSTWSGNEEIAKLFLRGNGGYHCKQEKPPAKKYSF
jgi:hypothetical protein